MMARRSRRRVREREDGEGEPDGGQTPLSPCSDHVMRVAHMHWLSHAQDLLLYRQSKDVVFVQPHEGLTNYSHQGV